MSFSYFIHNTSKLTDYLHFSKKTQLISYIRHNHFLLATISILYFDRTIELLGT